MKQRIFTLLFALVSLATSAWGYDVVVDGICYNLNYIHHTASVTYGTDDYTDDVVIPQSITYGGKKYDVTSIGKYAFNDCSSLTSIKIPNSVTSIGQGAFRECKSLTSVNIPNGVTSISFETFYRCSSLTSIDIPDGVTSIEPYTFYNCSSLSSINIPDGVTSIGDGAFEYCSSLTSFKIPSSVTTIGKQAFDGCSKLKSLYIFAKQISYYNIFSDKFSPEVVFANSSEIPAIKQYYSGKVLDIKLPYCFIVDEIKLGSITFSIANAHNKYVPGTLKSVTFKNKKLTPDEIGKYTISGLEPDTQYEVEVTCQNENGEVNSYTTDIRTKTPTISVSLVTRTQTTLKISVDVISDGTCVLTRKGARCGDKDYYCTGDEVVISGLHPNISHQIYPFAEYGKKRIMLSAERFWTASMNPSITAKVGPTSISVTGSYEKEGEEYVSETGFTYQGTGNSLLLTGLTPNTSYSVEYYVKTEEGGYEKKKQTFTTSYLELTTLQPRCVSSSRAIATAETNMSNDENNAGFQWKKTLALQSELSEGYAGIYNGQLEGYINNLQQLAGWYKSCYDVRAFYKSAEGKYYYSDWVTFDPSDFSYFEPTVHTYAATDVTHNSVQVKGYVLAGTESIDEQGFEYWATNGSAANALRVQATTKAAADDIHTVLAKGQVMTAELRDLQPETTYCCRAFVKTATGTVYGEEQTFTTEADLTGIDYIVTEEAIAPTVIGYYDMLGRKSATPHRGVNIVRYSNGTTRKVFMK